MIPTKLFRLMLDQIISPELINCEFCRQGNSFYTTRGSNIGIIDFQKSHKLEFDNLSFTVNIGVISINLLRFINQKEENGKLEISDAQWSVRLGQLMTEKKDIWWIIDENTNIDTLEKNIHKNILNFAFPELNKYIFDEAIRDLWFLGHAPSLTEFQRLLYLSYFLKTIGPTEMLEKTILDLERITYNKTTAITAAIYLEKLRKL
jgi:hypothetical protein